MSMKFDKLHRSRNAIVKADEQYERERLLRKGLAAQGRHIGGRYTLPDMPSEIDSMRRHELEKHSLLGHPPAGEHGRIEFGTTSTEHGEIMIAFDRDSETLHLHGVAHPIAALDASTRGAIWATASEFNAAETDLEQSRQKIILAALINAAMARDEKLSGRVKSAVQRQRYD